MPSTHQPIPSDIDALAQRHGIGREAAEQLWSAIVAGGGRQAQFNHPDLGGMGQWSHGGMIMIGDMFNQPLKARVAALCDDLARLVHDAGTAPVAADATAETATHDRDGTERSPAPGQRWPAELGAPAASGSQNDMHYAIFPQARRLAIERAGKLTVYDTQDHRIGGIAQQQGGEASLRFTSQSGPVALADLTIVTPQDA